MTIKQNLILREINKKPIIYDLYFQESKQPIPLVVFCHGYKGFKDWGAWHKVAQAFAEAGLCFLKFNFSHNGGTMENPIDFPDLDAFAENNFNLELEDLNRVLDSVELGNKDLNQEISSVSLIGHSRGGGIVLIKSSEDPRINKVVTWASVSDFKKRFHEGTDEFDNWRKKGVTFVENTRTKQQLPHNFQFYEDFKANEKRFTISRAVQALNIPQLIIHGEEDPTVSLGEGRILHSWNPKSRLEIIPKANHVFGTGHPWDEPTMPPEMKKVVQLTIDFLK